MATSPANLFDDLINHAADLLAERLSGFTKRARAAAAPAVNRGGPGGASANAKRRRAMLGRKLDMSCRVAGCPNRSSGPGKGYMCPAHQTLSKKKQQAARDAWKAKHAA